MLKLDNKIKKELNLIIADTLEETNSEFNTIKLENSYTTIDQKGVLTNISAGHAIITNNYENFIFR